MSTTHISSRRVLFVDDEPAFLELLGEAMKVYSGGNWDIDLATTTSKALAILEQKQVHLVVVDIHMPVVDGIQFLKLLQRKYPNIPRAVLTGDASEDHRSACLANGVELFLAQLIFGKNLLVRIDDDHTKGAVHDQQLFFAY